MGGRVRAAVERIGAEWRALPGFHRGVLVGSMAAAALVVVVYALVLRPAGLRGDQIEYDTQGRFFTEGKLWWSTVVTGAPHATAWKSPAYPAWVGFWYELVGASPVRLAVVQGLLLAPLTVLLSWLAARRWFDLRIAAVAAPLVALFPLSWEYFGLLYSEALAIPFTVLILWLAIDRGRPSVGRVVALGVLVGALILVRPTSFFLFAVLAASWIVAVGWRRGVGLTAVAVFVAVLVVVPWTVRNAVVLDGFVPISIQDAAAYGTFNEEAANDPIYPYAWRPTPAGVIEQLEAEAPASEIEFRSLLQDRARDYIREHPASVPKAFFWNGLSRLWDIRRPARALIETDFDGRSKGVTAVGLGIYYLLLPLALIGLWRVRRRPGLVVPLVAGAAALSVVFTIQAGTRYRAPVEPVIVILAASSLVSASGFSRLGPALDSRSTGAGSP